MTTSMKQIQSQGLPRMLEIDGTPDPWNSKPVTRSQRVMSFVGYRPTSHWLPTFLNSRHGYWPPDLEVAGYRSTRVIAGYCSTKSEKKPRQPSLWQTLGLRRALQSQIRFSYKISKQDFRRQRALNDGWRKGIFWSEGVVMVAGGFVF